MKKMRVYLFLEVKNMRVWMIIVPSSVVVVCGLLIGLLYYQTTHFNAHVQINHVNVGRLTASQAREKLGSTISKNVIYIGQKQMVDDKDTKMDFTDRDVSNIRALLHKQRTVFPSSKERKYMLKPVDLDKNHSDTMQRELEQRLLKLNSGLSVPRNASVSLENGKIIVFKGKIGTRYDIPKLLKAYRKQAFNSEVHLAPLHQQPVRLSIATINQEKKKLQTLVRQNVNYTLQDKNYAFKGNDVIKNVTFDNKMNAQINTDIITKKLDVLNHSLSTLHKNYMFKSHAGKMISVKGKSYGWAINDHAEAQRIGTAFSKGMSSIPAYHVYGEGWNTNGIGYHNPTNHGIGNTYVEVSIQAQRIWVYKNGHLAVTTPVVTGTKVYNEDTPKGVWYIEYKNSPAVLKGSEVGSSNYSVNVNYWAPFTQGGSGFHDAGWRTNWSKTAYIKNGSGGCVNTPPNIMKKVYSNVSQYEPVVVY